MDFNSAAESRPIRRHSRTSTGHMHVTPAPQLQTEFAIHNSTDKNGHKLSKFWQYSGQIAVIVCAGE
jgi:hypothetical protein